MLGILILLEKSTTFTLIPINNNSKKVHSCHQQSKEIRLNWLSPVYICTITIIYYFESKILGKITANSNASKNSFHVQNITKFGSLSSENIINGFSSKRN
jgi:glycopeptide antibiotics resistance protein